MVTLGTMLLYYHSQYWFLAEAVAVIPPHTSLH